jgi:hypothetical protein
MKLWHQFVLGRYAIRISATAPAIMTDRGLLDCDAVECVVGRRQHGPLKRRYPTTTLHGVTTQKPRLKSSLDGGSMDLWNVGILPQHYTASQPRRPRLENITAVKPSELASRLRVSYFYQALQARSFKKLTTLLPLPLQPAVHYRLVASNTINRIQN